MGIKRRSGKITKDGLVKSGPVFREGIMVRQ
jgi:hypothetical protein